MSSGRQALSAGVTWSCLAGIVVVAAVLTVRPELRSPVTAVGCVVAVGMILIGVVLHRSRSVAWLMLALMVALWTAGVLMVAARGSVPVAAVACVWAGQLVAAGVTVQVLLAGDRRRAGSSLRSVTAGLDLIVMAVVLTLVGAQVVRAGRAGDTNPTAVVVSAVDVALLGMLVRLALSRRGLVVSNALVIAAAFLAIVYDLTSAVHGRRIALPGEAGQVVGVSFMLLFGVAALHPSMTSAFSAETFALRRRPSTALLGLLPLALVPFGVWWVAEISGVRSLPPWAVPAAGAVIAAACLVRASTALRGSEHLAEHDPLTDLANRRGLARAYDEMRASAGRSLLLVDLDEFKQVNDTHGHDIGDALLQRLRDRLLAATGAAGVTARLGGDEFVVLTTPDQAPGVAERFLEALREPVAVDDLVLRAGASIGIAVAPAHLPLGELLTHADVAMYAAKAAGGNQALHFHPDMRVEVARRFTLSSDVRQLLGHENPDVGRLEIQYQPLVELLSGRMIGAEALVRWRHPDLGLLAPDAFLGLVTNNNLDADLDTAVLREVVLQLARWREQGLPSLPVSVNLTRDSLEDPRLADRVLAALSATGVPPAQLHVEITEHHQLSPDSPAEHTLQALRAAGVGIYLDDYGTGYTSLEYLRRFPIQVLKLDRSVVTSLDGGEVPLVAAVNAMAAALDLDVLAEGVETAEQRTRLVELGVRFGQGYLFSRPLPVADYEKALRTAEQPLAARSQVHSQ